MSIKNAVARKRDEEWRRYAKTVREGQRDFVRTGTALGMLRVDGHHKEQGYASFEDLVEAEFDMPKSTAYRLIEAARVVTVLSQLGTIQSKITNQAQALALSPIRKDPEALAAVIDAAERTGRITAATLEAARTELYPHIKVIDGEVVSDRPALVDGMRAAIEGVAENQKKTADEPLVSSDGDQATSSATPPPAAGVGAPQEAGRPAPAVTPKPAELPPHLGDEDGADMSPSEERPPADSGREEAAGDETGEEMPSEPVGGEGQQDEAGVPDPAVPSPGRPEEPSEEDEGDDEGDEDGGELPPAPVPHTGDPAALIAWFADRFDEVDADVCGPLLASDDLAMISESLGRIVDIVDRLTDWHERTQ